MTRRSIVALSLLVGLFTVPAAVQAQSPFLFFGGGATLPMGDFGDDVETGWMGTIGFGVPVGTGRVAIGGEAYFSRSTNKVPPFVTGDETNLFGGGGWVGVRLGEPGRVAPYVLGSVGVLALDFAPADQFANPDTELKVAFSGGAGVDIPLSGRLSLYIEGRYMMRGSEVQFIPILAGISIGLQ